MGVTWDREGFTELLVGLLRVYRGAIVTPIEVEPGVLSVSIGENIYPAQVFRIRISEPEEL